RPGQGQGQRDARRPGLDSQAPIAASRACASASVHTRQIVERLGQPAGITPARRYRSVTMPSGTSATHPATAVYPFIPPTDTTPRHMPPALRRPTVGTSPPPPSRPSRSPHPTATATSTIARLLGGGHDRLTQDEAPG